MNRAEVVAALGIDDFTFFTLVRSEPQKLTANKFGNEWSVAVKDLDAFRHRNPHLSKAPIDYRHVKKWLASIK
jgi:hypothetical protein